MALEVSGGKGDEDPPRPGGGAAIDSGGDGGKRGAGKVDGVRGGEKTEADTQLDD